MSVLIFLIISYILLSISLFFLFKKTEIEPWKGLVPGLNFVEWARLIGRKPTHALWLLFPIVNIFIYAGMAIDMVRSFGKYRFRDSVLAVVYAPAYFFYLAYANDEKYIGPTLIAETAYAQKLYEAEEGGDKYKLKKLQANNPYKKSQPREWAESIIFAVFAAAFIRMFLIEAYTIPTSSMEGSLLVGDYLFVSKIHYGLRTPQTVLQIPLLHNMIPVTGGESYLKKPQLPYYRFPKITPVKRNDPVVFNWPVGDSVYLTPERSYAIGQIERNNLEHQFRNKKLITRPMDKTDFYIKRCIGVPGDTLRMVDRKVYIDGAPIQDPAFIQYMYLIDNGDKPINTRRFKEVGINVHEVQVLNGQKLLLALNQKQVDFIKEIAPGAEVEIYSNSPDTQTSLRLFPHDPTNFPGWTIDDYGPIWIPKAGKTIDINVQNIALYKRIIGVYEGHDLSKKENKIYIDGEEAETYTFKYDYYWMMGDNRHNSEDSRFWGFVPETHIVGKPLFIFFSANDGIRWDRVFSNANHFVE